MKKITSALLVTLAATLATAPTFAHAGLEEGTAAYNNKDYAKALDLLLPVAQGGNARAQYLVGSMYMNATGTAKSEAEAAKWLRLSARQGDVASMKAVAGLLVQGKGVAQNLDEASQWFQRAEEATTRTETKEGAGGEVATNQSAAQVFASTCTYPSPSIPGRIYDRNIAGVVRAAVLIDDGMPKDVIIYSGPKVYHEVFRKALMQYDCSGKKLHIMAKRGYTSIGYGPQDRALYTVEQREPQFEFTAPSFNSDWNGLGLEQKMSVRGQYANMAAEDEPPYPTEGMGELLENIRLVAERLQSPGGLRFTVKVGADGKVEAVNLLEVADPELGKYTAEILYHTSFKPALCAKQACAMSFPIDAVVERTVINDDPAVEKELNALRKAAEGGAPRAQYDMGRRYEFGYTVKKDVRQAIAWYEKSGNQGDVHAQMALARIYSPGFGSGPDLPQAVVWLRKAAEQGHYYAQYKLGHSYAHGFGVAIDVVEGLKWYQKSADQGYTAAQNNLADIYENGSGVPVDLAQAVKWYSLAANQRGRVSIFSLAHMYADGRGVPRDMAKALSMMQDAAEMGLPKAQFDLGQMYVQGKDVEKNTDAALQWYRRAAKNGSKDAVAKLAELGLKS